MADLAVGISAYTAGNYEVAAREFMESAHQGDDDAQMTLGFMYANGEGVTRDDVEAAKWFAAAAAQGNPLAQISLGSAYADGKGVAEDYDLAIQWFTTAADQGHAKAQ